MKINALGTEYVGQRHTEPSGLIVANEDETSSIKEKSQRAARVC